jgi:hypothetical protein
MSNAKQVKAVEPLINGLPATATFKSGDGVALFVQLTQQLLVLSQTTLATPS